MKVNLITVKISVISITVCVVESTLTTSVEDETTLETNEEDETTLETSEYSTTLVLSVVYLIVCSLVSTLTNCAIIPGLCKVGCRLTKRGSPLLT